MHKMTKSDNQGFFDNIATTITSWTGSSFAFLTAAAIVIVWAVSGPFFNFSETWQLVINTGTTIITFLMVFIIQKSQNKDSKAVQLKLNELIAANRHTSNRMVDIEDLTEDELNNLRDFYKRLSDLAEEEDDIHQSHSIDAAEKLQRSKSRIRENRLNKKKQNELCKKCVVKNSFFEKL